MAAQQQPSRHPHAQPTLGLELKAAWCAKLLRGEKVIELRRYPINPAYLGQPVFLLQTPDGCEGRSTLPESSLPAGFPGATVAGVVAFDGETEYTSYEQFAADFDKHRVAAGTPYSWQPGVTRALYGWHITRVQAFATPQQVPAMRRVQSSWFVLDQAATEGETLQCGAGPQQ